MCVVTYNSFGGREWALKTLNQRHKSFLIHHRAGGTDFCFETLVWLTKVVWLNEKWKRVIETTSKRRGELWPSGDSRIYTQAAVGQHTISSYTLEESLNSDIPGRRWQDRSHTRPRWGQGSQLSEWWNQAEEYLTERHIRHSSACWLASILRENTYRHSTWRPHEIIIGVLFY